ncbi:MAG: hypothetical protein AB1424_09160 [Thermodesulfobacteriota bacterium]
MKKLIDILKRCECILTSAKAPKSDIKTLITLIDNIEHLSHVSLEQFYAHIHGNLRTEKQPIKEKKINVKISRTLTDIDKIANTYRKVKENKLLSDFEEKILTEIESKYPYLRSFLLDDLSNLYNRISEVDENIWSMEELKILLCFHFHIKPSKSTNKNKLLAQLRKNIYNLNYMDSMKRQYERKTK